ncbi:MAG: electron transfer flavoprotein subunit beta/FixA family protein [Lachnospiraceae bacterium]
MKIAVCMKQVPATSEGDMDKETGMLRRAGLEAIANIYDLAALEAALRMKEKHGGSVHVFTMGPEKAEAVLREAFAMGADEGYLICGREFAGADVLATSYTLMQAIKSAGSFDLIVCGRQTTDGDTAQVSGALARWMKLLHVNWVKTMDVSKDGSLEIVYGMERRDVKAMIKLPCLVAVERDSFVPRMPSLKLKINGKKKPIHKITIADLEDKNAENYGLSGSATKVKRIFPPEQTVKRSVMTMGKEEAAEYIVTLLEKHMQEEIR